MHGDRSLGARDTGLDFRDNQLIGPIPPELSGPLPPELGGLVNLGRLFLGGNEFSGCIPRGLRDTRHNSEFEELGLPYCS